MTWEQIDLFLYRHPVYPCHTAWVKPSHLKPSVLVLKTGLLTYLLTPGSTLLLEKVTGFQIVNKFLAFYGTRRFVTAATRAHNLSLSWSCGHTTKQFYNEVFFNWRQYCNFSEAQTVGSLMMVRLSRNM